MDSGLRIRGGHRYISSLAGEGYRSKSKVFYLCDWTGSIKRFDWQTHRNSTNLELKSSTVFVDGSCLSLPRSNPPIGR